MKPTDRLMGKNRLVLHSILTNMMKWNRYLHILPFLHFMYNRDGVDTKEGNCDRLWEMQDIFEILNRKFSRFHNPSENMATDVIVLFRGIIYSENIFPRSTAFLYQTTQITQLDTQKYAWERTGRAWRHS